MRMAARSSFGQIDAFQPENESIEAYLERIEVFFAANEIARDKQVSVFLSVLGGKTYTLLRIFLLQQSRMTRLWTVWVLL